MVNKTLLFAVIVLVLVSGCSDDSHSRGSILIKKIVNAASNGTLPSGCGVGEFTSFNGSIWVCTNVTAANFSDTTWSIVGSKYLINQSDVLDVNESRLNITINLSLSQKAGIGSAVCSGSDKLLNVTLTPSGVLFECGSDLNTPSTRWVLNTSDLINISDILSINYTTLDSRFVSVESDPVFVAENVSIWLGILSKLNLTDQRYNDTAIVEALNNSFMTLKLNSSDQRYNETGIVQALNNSFMTLKLNSSDQRYNETLIVQALNNSFMFIKLNESDQRYNDTGIVQALNNSFMTLKLNSSDQRYNESTIVQALNNSFMTLKLNSSDQRYNDTIRDYINSTQGNNSYANKSHTHNNFTVNVNMSTNNLTVRYLCLVMDCSSYIYNNGTHTIIK